MINEHVTLGKKSLCHHLTGWLDLHALVSLEVWMGWKVCRFPGPADFPNPSAPPRGWVWGIFIRSPIPSNLSIRTPPTGQGVGLSQGEAPSCFQRREHSVNSSPQLPPSMVWGITAPSAQPPTGQPLFGMTLCSHQLFFYFKSGL